MSERLLGKVKFVVPAGRATAAAPVGPALGQRGINSKAFCDEFNKITEKYNKGTPLHTTVLIYSGKFHIKVHRAESMTALIKKAAQIEKGAQTPGKESVSTLNMKQIQEIAEQKMLDTNTISIKSMCKIIIGTAKSMGVTVEGNVEDIEM